MSEIEDIISEIQTKIAPTDETLVAARSRRDEVLSIAKQYNGVLRTYYSGSIAHRTANDDTDADCGVVLDRRTYPDLGPDGKNISPTDVVEEMRSLIREELKANHPNVTFRLTKRAIRVVFNEPLSNQSDPSVDLIVGLTRAEGAIWIPNLEIGTWDASDPEFHTQMLTAEPATLRRMRAKVIRLAKAWNKQYSQPGLCSFNIEALACKAIETETSICDGLSSFFNYASKDLAKRQTPDPAGVSKPIKTLIDRETVVNRLTKAATNIDEAITQTNNNGNVRDTLADLFWVYVNPSSGSSSKAAYARALNNGNSAVRLFPGGISVATTGGLQLKTTRSFGDNSIESW